MFFILIGLLIAFTHRHHNLNNDFIGRCFLAGMLEFAAESIVIGNMLSKAGLL